MFTPPNMSRVTCHVSRVTCHVSHVTCHVSHVPFFSFFFRQSGGAYWLRVCHQRGYPVQFLKPLGSLGFILCVALIVVAHTCGHIPNIQQTLSSFFVPKCKRILIYILIRISVLVGNDIFNELHFPYQRQEHLFIKIKIYRYHGY